MQGHIRKRGQGSWGVVISLGKDPTTGKYRQLTRSIRGRKRDAEALLRQLLLEQELGIDQSPEKLSVGDFLTKWLASMRPSLAPKTYNRYADIVRVHLQPTLGAIPIGKLRPLRIEQAYAAIRDTGISGYTQLFVHRLLRQALKKAILWRYITTNPTDAVTAPRPAKREVPVLKIEQVNRLLEVADSTPYGELINLALMSGLRRGELFGLKWEDVSLGAATLSVRRTCQWLPDGVGFYFKEPKTRKARVVDLSSRTVERLRGHRLAQVEQRLAAGPAYDVDGLDLVFADGLGRPIHQTNLRTAWLGIIKTAALPGLRFHDVRHQHASLLLLQGTPMKVVQERLGHANLATTADMYSHVAPTMQAEAASKLDELLANS